MSRPWARPVLLVTGLAVVALLGAGIALGPRRPAGPPAAPPTGAPPTSALAAYVVRTSAHLATVPGDWQAWAQLGMAHIQLGRSSYDPAHYPAAEVALRRSLAVHPSGNAAALTGLGALAAARHDFTAALGFARRAIAVDGYSADAYGVLTDACVELGRYPDAIDAVQRMLDLRPDTGSFARASYVFELHGNVARATELMQRARELASEPDDVVFALIHLGELAFNAGQLDRAAALFAEGLARRPGQPALLADRAKVESARHDLAAASVDLRAATATLPTVDHLAALADVRTAAGDPAGAARADDLIRAGARLPGAAPAATDIDLVLFYADRGEARTALDLGRKLFAARPGVPVEIAYAWALHAAGQDRAALRHADHALRLGTRDARAHYYRGMVRLALRDRAGARADLAQAIRINPYFSLRYGPIARARLATLDGAA